MVESTDKTILSLHLGEGLPRIRSSFLSQHVLASMSLERRGLVAATADCAGRWGSGRCRGHGFFDGNGDSRCFCSVHAAESEKVSRADTPRSFTPPTR